MERSGGMEEPNREAERVGPSTLRLFIIVVAALLGSLSGNLLTVSLILLAPDYIVLTLPSLFGALFASSAAYLVSGASVAPLSRVLAYSTMAALICAAFNLALLGAVLMGYVNSVGLEPLAGGWPVHLLETIVIGSVAAIVVSRPGPARQRRRSGFGFWISLCISLVAALILLETGSAIWPSGPFTGA